MIVLRLGVLYVTVEWSWRFSVWILPPAANYPPAGATADVPRALVDLATQALAFSVVMMTRRESIADAGVCWPATRAFRWMIPSIIYGLLLAALAVVVSIIRDVDTGRSYFHSRPDSDEFLVFTMWSMAASVLEELLFRVACLSLIEELARHFVGARLARSLAIAVSLTWFAATHWPSQGWFGVAFAALAGVVFTLLFLKWGKSVAPAALSHVVTNIGINVGWAWTAV